MKMREEMERSLSRQKIIPLLQITGEKIVNILLRKITDYYLLYFILKQFENSIRIEIFRFHS